MRRLTCFSGRMKEQEERRGGERWESEGKKGWQEETKGSGRKAELLLILRVFRVIKIPLCLFSKNLFPQLFPPLPHPLALNNWSVHFLSPVDALKQMPPSQKPIREGAPSRARGNDDPSAAAHNTSALSLEAFRLFFRTPPTLCCSCVCS